MGEIGATNLRVISQMTLQKPWEPWDGNFPIQELFELDSIRWVSINSKNIEKDISDAIKWKHEYFEKFKP
jgi:hypothetical protein